MSATRRVVVRYLLFQVPGWTAAGVAAWFAPGWLGLPGWAGAVGFAAWVAKDAALFPFVRSAYEDSEPRDHRVEIGARAVATEPLSPGGFVRVGSELWRAELAQGSPPVGQGATVRVRSVEGMMLIVEGDAEADL